MISESCKDASGLRVHVFNSFFYSKLSQSGYAGVRRWTKKVCCVLQVLQVSNAGSLLD